MSSERVRCFYCGDPVIEARVERDHFPIPESCGGTQTVDTCQQCHDLKDRTDWKSLPAEFKGVFMEQLAQMPREAKIVFAQFMRLTFEALKRPPTIHHAQVGDRFIMGDRQAEVTAVTRHGDVMYYAIKPIES